MNHVRSLEIFAYPATTSKQDVATSATVPSGSGYSSLHSGIAGLDNQCASVSVLSDATKQDNLKPQLYVHCSSPCHSIQPGKLRVCCQLCKQGSFTVQRDPTCWEDVLTKGAVTGTCQADGCHGETSEFYFKCANHPTSDNERSVVLQHIKTNTRQVMCITCADIRNPVLVFPCADKHAICLECFHDYCLTQLSDRRFVQHDELGYTLSCPSGCEESFITEVHHFKILGDEQYDRFKRFAAEECLLKIGGVLCPSPGCGAGILTEDRRVECVQQGHNGCGAVFCKDCRGPYHSGACQQAIADGSSFTSSSSSTQDRYQVDTARAASARWERQRSEDTIQATTKACPQCKTPTEKDGGCMHMTCSRPQCKFDWCWVCRIEWNHRCMADHWFDVY